MMAMGPTTGPSPMTMPVPDNRLNKSHNGGPPTQTSTNPQPGSGGYIYPNTTVHRLKKGQQFFSFCTIFHDFHTHTENISIFILFLIFYPYFVFG